MTAAVGQRPIMPPVAREDRHASTWQGRVWETGKEVAITALPFLTLYKPLSFPVAVGMGALRVGISTFQLVDAIREQDKQEILLQCLHTAVAVASLAGTIFAHPVGLLISTGYDLILETRALIQFLRDGEYQKAAESSLKIIGHALYTAVFFYGGPEVTIAFFAVQIAIGCLEAHHEFKGGHYIAGVGHVLMAMLRGGQLAGQVKVLQTKWEIQRALQNPAYVGKLAEKWQFPSDHLPVGAKVGNAHIISWNVLNDNYMSWVLEQDSQGLNGSLISELHAKPSQNYPGLTMRDELVMTYLLQIINNPSHHNHIILNLQECESPHFIQALSSRLPSDMGMVASDTTFRAKDQNIVIYNQDTFTYLQDQSGIVKGYPNTDSRTLMDLAFVENATQQKFQMINAHVPGDPNLPGRYDFANYVLSHGKPGYTTVAAGDMNFTGQEMQKAFERESKTLNVPLSFRNLSTYNTNVGAYTFEAKSIDHIWTNTELPCKTMSPDEVLPGLQSTVDLLHPNTTHDNWFWQKIESHFEYLKKWFQSKQEINTHVATYG